MVTLAAETFNVACGVVTRSNGITMAVPVPDAVVLVLMGVTVTVRMVAASAAARAGTLTVPGVDGIQAVPLNSQRVFTLKLAGFACRPVMVYVMTTSWPI